MGSFSTLFSKGYTLKVEWTESGVDAGTNTSDLTVKVLLVTSGTYHINSTAQKNISLTVNGTTYNGTCYVGIGGGETKTLFTQTVSNIPHNADGSKTVAISCTLGIKVTLNGSYVGSVSASGSATLTTIARASQPSCVTWPNHTQNVGEFGDEISIHMNRNSSAFTHTVRYAFGSRTGTIGTGIGTGTTWTIPKSLMDLIPNATSGSGTIYVDTYNGSTLIGTKSCGFTATVPASVKPSCSFTLEDITGVDKIYGSPVKGLSKIKVTVNTTLAYSSPIKSYEITANGRRYTASPATTDFLSASGTSAVTATVKDGRGRSGTASYDMNVQAYTAPAVTAMSAQRCNQDGTLNKRGAYIKVVFTASVSSMNSKNTALYYLKYKKTSETAYSTVSFSALTNNYAPKNQSYIFAAAQGSSYDVAIEAVDRHNTGRKSAKVATAVSILSWRGFKMTNGVEDGIGIGKVPEKPNTLQVGWPAEFDDDVLFQSNQYCFGTNAGNVMGYVAMVDIEISSVYANAPITFEFSHRSSPSTMTVHVRFYNENNLTPSLNTIVYEGDNYGAFLVNKGEAAGGSRGSVWTLYIGKLYANDWITLQRWTAPTFMNGRIKLSFPGSAVETVPLPFYRATPAKLQSILDYVYPVGSIYLAYNHTSPATLFGGTWERISNAFLWAVDGSGQIGLTGGAREVALTEAQIPAHSHGSVYSQHATGTKDKGWYNTSGTSVAYGPVSAGGGEAHNNMPPYIQISAWRRTA